MKKLLLFLILFTMIYDCSSSPKNDFPSKIQPQVLVIIYNPIIESEGNKRLTDVFSWNDPDSLAEIYRNDLFEVSDGYLDYQIVKRIEVDEDEAYAANSVMINGTLLMPAGYPKIHGQLAGSGYNILPVDTSEYRKLDGGISCLSLRF